MILPHEPREGGVGGGGNGSVGKQWNEWSSRLGLGKNEQRLHLCA